MKLSLTAQGVAWKLGMQEWILDQMVEDNGQKLSPTKITTTKR